MRLHRSNCRFQYYGQSQHCPKESTLEYQRARNMPSSRQPANLLVVGLPPSKSVLNLFLLTTPNHCPDKTAEKNEKHFQLRKIKYK